MRDNFEAVEIGDDPQLAPLEAQQSVPPLVAPFVRVPGQLASIDGQPGPDIIIATAAPLNGVALTKSSAANTVTLGITGIGTMAQRGAVAANVDAVSPDATDLPTALTLLNELKAQFNALQAKMRAAGHLTP